jgi:hypothetical protein
MSKSREQELLEQLKVDAETVRERESNNDKATGVLPLQEQKTQQKYRREKERVLRQLRQI